jgi:hypothetical protein
MSDWLKVETWTFDSLAITYYFKRNKLTFEGRFIDITQTVG